MGRTLLNILVALDTVKPITCCLNGFFDLRQVRFRGIQSHDMGRR